MLIKRRPCSAATYRLALAAGLPPRLAQIVAARLPDFQGDLGTILQPGLRYIDHPERFKDADKAAERIADAVIQRQRIGILTDYDVDGVTSHAVIYRVLTAYFRLPSDHIVSLIGHRLRDGYGVSTGLTERILAEPPLPDLIITADCGSSDEACIARLRAAGIDVIVTDHHALPLAGPPASAYAVINPNQADCAYPDGTIAGCMTAWLLLCHVRAKLVGRGYLPATAPKLSRELDYVSLGTVADCVSIGTPINRAVVSVGLQQINDFQRPCWRAIRSLLNRADQPFKADDLGFQVGPRINARSRLDDPYAALRYLLATSDAEASRWLGLLDGHNEDRKLIEREMVELARRQAEAQVRQGYAALVIYLADGHPGVQGIVASRLVETFGRPAVVLCPANEADQLSGSARSIVGLHLRDALQQVADRQPELFVKFGGHRAAAGLTLYREQWRRFQPALERAVRAQLGAQDLYPVVWTDGALDAGALTLATVAELEQLQPYGREFEEPVFEGVFDVETVRTMGADPIHLGIRLRSAVGWHDAVWFRALDAAGATLPFAPGDRVHCAYRLRREVFRGEERLRLQLVYAAAE